MLAGRAILLANLQKLALFVSKEIRESVELVTITFIVISSFLLANPLLANGIIDQNEILATHT